MRISDWSSDVCSSDLEDVRLVHVTGHALRGRDRAGEGVADRMPRFLAPRIVRRVRTRRVDQCPVPAAAMLVAAMLVAPMCLAAGSRDRKSTRLNSSH